MRTHFALVPAALAAIVACGATSQDGETSKTDSLGVAAAPATHRFEPGTLTCPSGSCPDGQGYCFCPAEQAIFDGTPPHFVYVGGDPGVATVSAAGNTPVAVINSLEDVYHGTAGVGRDLGRTLDALYTRVPSWVLVNEISRTLWENDGAYRDWLVAQAGALKRRGINAIVASQYRGYDVHERDVAVKNGGKMQELSTVAYIGIEAYEDIRAFEKLAQAQRDGWCRARYQQSIDAYKRAGIDVSRLVLIEDYANSRPFTDVEEGYGQQHKPDALFYDFIDRTARARVAVAHDAQAFGTMSYDWGHDGDDPHNAATLRNMMTRYILASGGQPGTPGGGSSSSSGGSSSGGSSSGGSSSGGSSSGGPPPTPIPPGPSQCGALLVGQGLSPAAPVLTSCDGRFTLVMQGDGNLVEYWGTTPLWATRTDRSDGEVAVMQTDGNFVLYGHTTNPLWSSNTFRAGSYLALQNDSNLVIYNGGTAVWASGTFIVAPPQPPTQCTILSPNQGLVAGQSFGSCGGHYHLDMQGDGNLVLYHDSRAIWSSGTFGTAGYEALFQGDGNLVVYTAHGNPLWASNTSGHPGALLQVQDDGNMVIYAGAPIWATNTQGQ